MNGKKLHYFTFIAFLVSPSFLSERYSPMRKEVVQKWYRFRCSRLKHHHNLYTFGPIYTRALLVSQGWRHIFVTPDLQSLFGHSHTYWPRPRNPTPPPRIWAHIRECYWSAKVGDISLWPQISKIYLGSMCTSILIGWFSAPTHPPSLPPAFGLI
jgi:hypothetical protein